MSDIRGFLAANLHCWHRLSGTESDELLALFSNQATRIAELEQQLADAKQAARWESDLASQALDHMKLMENALQYCPFCGNEIIDPAIQGERHDG